LKTISKILFDSIGKRVQSFTNLTEVRKQKGKYKITKYCAIGAIGCENKIIKLGKAEPSDYQEYDLKTDSEYNILHKAGISKKIIEQDFRTHVTDFALKELAKKSTYSLRRELTLENLIMGLNDGCKWSYQQIGEELARLEKRGCITYNEQVKTN